MTDFYSNKSSMVILLQSWIRKMIQTKKFAQLGKATLDLSRISSLVLTRLCYSTTTVRDEGYRCRVVAELVSSEREYVSNLMVLTEVLFMPLKEQQSALSIQNISAEIEVILAFSKVLLQDLEPRTAAWSPHQLIGDVMLLVTDYMKVYTQYVKDYGMFTHLLAESKKNSHFLHILKVRSIISLPVLGSWFSDH